jgi:hypothetical protein
LGDDRGVEILDSAKEFLGENKIEDVILSKRSRMERGLPPDERGLLRQEKDLLPEDKRVVKKGSRFFIKDVDAFRSAILGQIEDAEQRRLVQVCLDEMLAEASESKEESQDFLIIDAKVFKRKILEIIK